MIDKLSWIAVYRNLFIGDVLRYRAGRSGRQDATIAHLWVDAATLAVVAIMEANTALGGQVLWVWQHGGGGPMGSSDEMLCKHCLDGLPSSMAGLMPLTATCAVVGLTLSLFALLGMFVMISGHFPGALHGLELMALVQLRTCRALRRDDAAEAMKYFVLSAHWLPVSCFTAFPCFMALPAR
jgi:NADH-quinone oxidoreductase subunit N